jgi:hypothetical protein
LPLDLSGRKGCDHGTRYLVVQIARVALKFCGEAQHK